MITFRRFCASLLICIALLCGLMVLASSGAGIDHTIENSRTLDRQFREAASAVTAFERDHGHLPDVTEFDAIQPPGGRYQITLAPLEFQNCEWSSPVFTRLEPPDYVLTAWRGEWSECYAPTKGLSTLVLTPAGYTMFGSALLDQSAFAAAGLACLLLAIGLWRRWGRERGE